MLRELLETVIEIFGIDFHMLNASHRVDGQNLSVFHACNLSHHLRAVFNAAPLLENQRHILTLRQLYAAKMQDLAPQKHISDRDAKSTRRRGFASGTMRG